MKFSEMNHTEKLVNKNVERLEGYSQVCVWPGTVLGENDEPTKEEIKEFEDFFIEKLKTRIKFLEQIRTLPDTVIDETGDIKEVPETGGRCDLFFVVHNEDIGKFAVPRLQYEIRWIEDVLAKCNYLNPIYPERVFEYKTWDADSFIKLDNDKIIEEE